MSATEKLELFDLQDKRVSEITLPVRQPGAPPREIVWRGRLFREGGGKDSFYEPGQLAEVLREDV